MNNFPNTDLYTASSAEGDKQSALAGSESRICAAHVGGKRIPPGPLEVHVLQDDAAAGRLRIAVKVCKFASAAVTTNAPEGDVAHLHSRWAWQANLRTARAIPALDLQRKPRALHVDILEEDVVDAAGAVWVTLDARSSGGVLALGNAPSQRDAFGRWRSSLYHAAPN